MKRKGLKILCGVLATLSVLGATSTIVGALSDGFKNWDTSTWFDKGTSEPVTKEDLVTTPDESLPVKMSVSYLGDDTSIKRANSVKPMTGLVITASLDSEYGECNKFAFTFSSTDSSLFNYSVTDNTCTINFLKKYYAPIKVYAQTTSGSIRYRGCVNIDFKRSMRDNIEFGYVNSLYHQFFYNTESEPNCFYVNYCDEFCERAISFYYEGVGSLKNEIYDVKFEFIDNYLSFDYSNLFTLEKTSYDWRISLKEEQLNILDLISNDNYVKSNFSSDFLTIGKFKITLKYDDNKILSSLPVDFKFKPYKIVDNGIDMGGDIVVG